MVFNKHCCILVKVAQYYSVLNTIKFTVQDTRCQNKSRKDLKTALSCMLWDCQWDCEHNHLSFWESCGSVFTPSKQTQVVQSIFCVCVTVNLCTTHCPRNQLRSWGSHRTETLTHTQMESSHPQTGEERSSIRYIQ